MAPNNLSYASLAPIYTKGLTISPNAPTNRGGTVVSYSVNPPLPNGLTLDITQGVISGSAQAISPAANYVVTAYNSGGSTTVQLEITVNDVAPSSLYYLSGSATLTDGIAMTPITPTASGGPVVSYSVNPALPSGLVLDSVHGTLSGTPASAGGTGLYTFTATNSGGSTSTSFSIRVLGSLTSVGTLTYFEGQCVSLTITRSVDPQLLTQALPLLVTYGNGGTGNVYTSSDCAWNSQATTSNLPTIAAGQTSVTIYVLDAIPQVGSTPVHFTDQNGNYAPSVVNLVALSPINPAATLSMTGTFPIGVGTCTPVSLNRNGISPFTPANIEILLGSNSSPLVDAEVYTQANCPANSLVADGGVVTVPANYYSMPLYLKVPAVGAYVIWLSNREGVYAPTQVTFGVGYSFTINTPINPINLSNLGGPFTCSVTPALPIGLQLDPQTCILSGTPTQLSVNTEYWIGESSSNGGGSQGIYLAVIAPVTDTLEISSSTNNYNIATALKNPTSPVNAQLTVDFGVVVGSTDSGTPALTTGALPKGSSVLIINNGLILGSGGAGGSGGNGGSGGTPHTCGRDGQPGGTAIQILVPTTISNSGQIYGGGGGGPGFSGCNAAAGGGGGGGFVGGAGGAGATSLTNAQELAFCGQDNGYRTGSPGSPGTSVGGNGGVASSNEVGGSGGNVGLPGNSVPPSTCAMPGSAGAPGAAGFAILSNGLEQGVPVGSYNSGSGPIAGPVN